ncbi:helix-turn-helix domain-containing protein [Streptomyces sp. NPDC000070]|uniref:transcriptional regulator n=1 Tax=Streptomyces sp. NPDC000070 TaxID=3154240 RepID=UPI00332C70D3
MGAAEETADFAALLRELKQRSGLSYEALAKRAHMSTSTLHRYCKGEGVPADYASVSRFARVCKATPEEVVELHRRWVVADAARERSRRAAADRGDGAEGTDGAEGAAAAAGQDRVSRPGSEPESAPGSGPEGAPGSVAGPGADSEPAALPGSGAAAVAEPGVAAVAASVSALGSPPEPGAESRPEAGVPTRRPEPRRSVFRKRRVVVAASTLAVVALTTAVLQSIDIGEDTGGRRVPAVAGSNGLYAPHGSASPSTSPSARPSRSPDSKTPGAKPSASVAGSATAPARGGAAPAPDTARDPVPDDDSVPLTVSARAHDWDAYCGTFYMVDRPPAQVPLPPPSRQDAPTWARDVGAVSAGKHRVSVTVQGTGDKAVVIESLHVRVVGSAAPLAWTAYEMGSGCGGGVEPREFGLDLDAAQPTVAPKGGQRGFPYKVSQSDPEVLYITAHTDTRDVKWQLELQWSSGGRQGTIEIKDGGKPFRTTSKTGRPHYVYVPGQGGGEWEASRP